MNKDRHNELDWFTQLEQDAYVERAKRLLKARKARAATRVAPTFFQRLLGLFKSILGLST